MWLTHEAVVIGFRSERSMSTQLPSQLKVYESITDIPRESWDALLDDAAHPFLEHGWLSCLEESGSITPKAGWHPRHLTLWRGPKLVAAAPAYLKDDSHGEFIFDWSWASAAERIGVKYYPKLIVAVPLAPATGRRILVASGEDRTARERELMQAALELARSEELSSVHVLFPTEGEIGSLSEVGFAPRLGVQYQWSSHGEKTFDEFLERFHSKRRNQLKRERRAPAEQGIEIRTLRGKDLSQIEPDDAFKLYVSTVDKFVWGYRHLNKKFFQLALERMAHRIEFVEARRKGKRIAGAFNVGTPKVLYGRYWGCFEDVPFLHFNVCLYHSVDECIRDGRIRFEPGAGGEHKLSRGFEPTLTHSAHHIFNPVLGRAVKNFLDAERAAIRDGLPQWLQETGYRNAGGDNT